MFNILINATNVVGSGPKALALSLLPELSTVFSNHKLRMLLPDIQEFRELKVAANTERIYFRRSTGFKNNILRMRELHFTVPYHAKAIQANACLTLGDVGASKLQCPEILFIQNSLFVYELSELGGQSSWGVVKSWYLKHRLKQSIKKVSAVVVQTPVMRDRLLHRYSIRPEYIHVIGQPVPVHVLRNDPTERHPAVDGIGGRLKLLFLAQYYPHKNHAVLAAVGEELKKRHLHEHVRILVTLNDTEWKKVHSSTPVVENLGRLKPKEVAAALRSSDALFLPTMVESYGLVYLEALMLNRPILTSDRDFAHFIAGQFAVYFDPMDPVSIVNAIEALPRHISEWPKKQNALTRHLESFPNSWGEVAEKFKTVTEKVIGKT